MCVCVCVCVCVCGVHYLLTFVWRMCGHIDACIRWSWDVMLTDVHVFVLFFSLGGGLDACVCVCVCWGVCVGVWVMAVASDDDVAGGS